MACCFFNVPTPLPLMSKLAERCQTAANEPECVFHRPMALTLCASVNIDIRGDGGSPTLTTSRMSGPFTDTGMSSHGSLHMYNIHIYIYIHTHTYIHMIHIHKLRTWLAAHSPGHPIVSSGWNAATLDASALRYYYYYYYY